MNNKGQFFVFFFVILFALNASASSNSWCRLDDPAPTEKERINRELYNSEIDKIACPVISSGSQYPKKLILPMPCGRKMVFQRVDFYLAHILDHKIGQFGKKNDFSMSANQVNWNAVTESAWTGVVSGGFTQKGSLSDGGPFVRSYYIGTYEVTEPQYQLWESELLNNKGVNVLENDVACESHRKLTQSIVGTQVFPATEVAWIDAVNFAHDYSQWLIALDQKRLEKNLTPLLPWEGSATGYIRLPTEEEWEYAARAGDLSTDIYNGLYLVLNGLARTPQSTDIDDIAVTLSSQNPSPNDSAVSYIGRKKPNLFGVYDIVGNADEIVFNLFSMIRPDGKVGQLGGYIVRGGNALQNKNKLGVHSRNEVPFFKSTGVVRQDTTGFRVLITVPALMNARDERYLEIMGNRELEAAISLGVTQMLDNSNLVGGVQREAATELVGSLQEKLNAGSIREEEIALELQKVNVLLNESTTKLNQRKMELIEERLQSAVLNIISMQTIGRSIISSLTRVKSISNDIKENGSTSKKKDLSFCEGMVDLLMKYMQAAERTESISDKQFEYYVDIIKKIATESNLKLTTIVPKVKVKFAQLKLKFKGLGNLTEVVISHVDEIKKNNVIISNSMLKKWRKQIDFKLIERRELYQQLLQKPWINQKIKEEKSPCI